MIKLPRGQKVSLNKGTIEEFIKSLDRTELIYYLEQLGIYSRREGVGEMRGKLFQQIELMKIEILWDFAS